MTTVPYAAKLLVRAEKVPSSLLGCMEFNSKLGIRTKKIFSSYLQGRVAFTLCLYHMSKNWRTKSVKSFSHSLHWWLYRHLSRACVYIYANTPANFYSSCNNYCFYSYSRSFLLLLPLFASKDRKYNLQI